MRHEMRKRYTEIQITQETGTKRMGQIKYLPSGRRGEETEVKTYCFSCAGVMQLVVCTDCLEVDALHSFGEVKPPFLVERQLTQMYGVYLSRFFMTSNLSWQDIITDNIIGY